MSQLIWNDRVWSALWPACDKKKSRTQFKIYFTMNFIMNMKTMTCSRAGIFPGWIPFLLLPHSLSMFHQSFGRFIEFTFNSCQSKKRFIQMQISVWTTVCFFFLLLFWLQQREALWSDKHGTVFKIRFSCHFTKCASVIFSF